MGTGVQWAEVVVDTGLQQLLQLGLALLAHLALPGPSRVPMAYQALQVLFKSKRCQLAARSALRCFPRC